MSELVLDKDRLSEVPKGREDIIHLDLNASMGGFFSMLCREDICLMHFVYLLFLLNIICFKSKLLPNNRWWSIRRDVLLCSPSASDSWLLVCSLWLLLYSKIALHVKCGQPKKERHLNWSLMLVLEVRKHLIWHSAELCIRKSYIFKCQNNSQSFSCNCEKQKL